MAKILENITASNIPINDIGITIPANGTYDVTPKDISSIANSDNLKLELSSGNIVLQKDPLAVPITYYTASEAMNILTLTNYYPPTDSQGNQIISTPGLRHIDGRISIHQSSRPLGTVVYFTGHGDDRTDKNNVGGGSPFDFNHIAGTDPTTHSIYADFNLSNNKSYIHEGYIIWENTSFDCLTIEIVPEVTSTTTGVNTSYTTYGGYLIVPAETPVIGEGLNLGTTSILSTDIRLIYVPLEQNGTRKPAYWNATWDSTTNQYNNILPAPNGDGEYNMFSIEVPLVRFVNRVPLMGTNYTPLNFQSSDSQEIGDGMRFKISGTTVGTDHSWKVFCIFTMHRTKTV